MSYDECTLSSLDFPALIRYYLVSRHEMCKTLPTTVITIFGAYVPGMACPIKITPHGCKLHPDQVRAS